MGKGGFNYAISLLAKEDLIGGNVLNPVSGGIASSHNNDYQHVSVLCNGVITWHRLRPPRITHQEITGGAGG